MLKKKNGPPKARKIPVRAVEVLWQDATGHSGWHSVDEAMRKEPVTMSTLGFLIDKNTRFVKLVRSFDSEGQDVGDVFTIPANWVHKIKRLR